MINPSNCWRILVGEVLRFNSGMYNGCRVLVSQITKADGGLGIQARMIDLDNTYVYDCRVWSSDHNLDRVGYIFDSGDIRNQEDHLCHHCFPSSFIGCSDCEYRGRSSTRKSIFYLGDEVYDPIWKQNYWIGYIYLALDTTKISVLPERKGEYDGPWISPYIIPSLGNSHYREFIELIREITEEDKRKSLTLLYRTSGNTRKTYFLGSELRLWKRHSYFLDREQLQDICSMCIFGEGSERCQTCETMTYRLVR